MVRLSSWLLLRGILRTHETHVRSHGLPSVVVELWRDPVPFQVLIWILCLIAQTWLSLAVSKNTVLVPPSRKVAVLDRAPGSAWLWRSRSSRTVMRAGIFRGIVIDVTLRAILARGVSLLTA